MLVVPVAGKEDALRYLLNERAAENIVLRLYVNDVAPQDGSGPGVFEEANFPGYEPQILIGGKWGFRHDALGSVLAEYPLCVFERAERGSPQRVYGYFATREKSHRIAWAERFQEPASVVNKADKVLVVPRLRA